MDILGRGIASAVLILVVLIVRQIAFSKVSKRVLMLIWTIPVIKLLVPVAELFYSHYYVTVSDVSIGTEAVYTKVVENCVVPDNLFYPCSIVFSLNIPDMLYVVWAFGAVLLTIYYMTAHIKCRRRYGCALPCAYDISGLQKDFGIKRRVRLLVSDRTDAPFTYGVFCPVIILPKIMGFEHTDSLADMQTGEHAQAETIRRVQLESVLCHELAHIKRLDILLKLLLAVCTVLYWYHPLVWVMSVFANRDMELACDEAVILQRNILPEEYALALIGMEERRSCPQAVSFAGGSLAKRITEIMSVKKTKYSHTAAAAVIVSCVIVGCIVNVAVVNVIEETDTYNEYEIEAQPLKDNHAVEEDSAVSDVFPEVQESDETVDLADRQYALDMDESTETERAVKEEDAVEMDVVKMEEVVKQKSSEKSSDTSGMILVQRSAKTKVKIVMDDPDGQIAISSSPVMLAYSDTENSGNARKQQSLYEIVFENGQFPRR